MSEPLVLVTGASGYVATHIVQQLLEAGYKVRGTVRSLQNEKKVGPLRSLCPAAQHNLELTEADLLDPDCWIKAVRGCSYVLHLASPVSVNWEDYGKDEDFIKPAVEGTLSVLRACRDVGGVRRVVVTSSQIAVANYTMDSRLYTDSDWADPKATPKAYNRSKILSEKAAWDFMSSLPGEHCSFDLVSIVASAAVGPLIGSHGSPSTEIARILLEKLYPVLIRLCINVIDVRDVALAHIRAMELPQASGKRFLVTGENLWVQEIAVLYSREFAKYGYNVPTRVVPWFILWISAFFKQQARDALAVWGTVLEFDNTPMKEILGVRPRSVRKGLIEMAYSMIERGIITKTQSYVQAQNSNMLT